MSDIIILAAGIGKRFGCATHKALAPMLLGEGTLSRLIRQLKYIHPVARIIIVTGYESEAIRRAVVAVTDTAYFAHNANYRESTALESLGVGLTFLQKNTDSNGAWVLFADTIYHPEALADIFSYQTTEITVACAPWSGEEDCVIEVAFDINNYKLLSIGPSATRHAHVMVPAVYWPRKAWPSLNLMSKQGLATQWQAIQKIAPNSARVLLIKTGHIKDIDTKEDLLKQRRQLIGQEDIVYFRDNISKDERNRWRTDFANNAHFTKFSATPQALALELSALKQLELMAGGDIAPALVATKGQALVLEHIQGIRLYDLFRLLRKLPDLDQDYESICGFTASTLLERCLSRLVRIQSALMGLPEISTLQPYPIDTHVAELLSRLLRLLNLPSFTPKGFRELEELAEQWKQQDAVIPFRDATPKNILVAIPELAPDPRGDDKKRLMALARWLELNEAATVRLVDYDFASVQHLTAPEDDFISLLAHQGSLYAGEIIMSRRQLGNEMWFQTIVKIPEMLRLPFAPDPARTARALLVRYLRFGGRKLMYRIINPAGYAVRFRHDDPKHYFLTLPKAIATLDPDFPQRWPEIYSRLKLLSDAVSTLPAWNPREARSDVYLERLGPGLQFWQESPSELEMITR